MQGFTLAQRFHVEPLVAGTLSCGLALSVIDGLDVLTDGRLRAGRHMEGMVALNGCSIGELPH